MNPEKARCVELSNARNFLKWTKEQPWMTLHELSHGYHHQFLKGGFHNPEVKKAFDHATKTRRYESVLRANGKKEKAYAATNPMEYFAEASEAYFGTNDFYPFDRAELERHDPEMFCARRQTVAQDLRIYDQDLSKAVFARGGSLASAIFFWPVCPTSASFGNIMMDDDQRSTQH